MLGLHFTPTCVLLLVCSLHFTHSLHFTPGPQSAVHSLHFTLTAKEIFQLLKILSLFKNNILKKLNLSLFSNLPFLFSSLQHSKYIKLNFSESSEKISFISFFSFELEVQLTKIYHTSSPPLFSGFCSVCNPYCKECK